MAPTPGARWFSKGFPSGSPLHFFLGIPRREKSSLIIAGLLGNLVLDGQPQVCVWRVVCGHRQKNVAYPPETVSSLQHLLSHVLLRRLAHQVVKAAIGNVDLKLPIGL